MASLKNNKIIFSIIFPFIILLLCLKGDFGNFNTETSLTNLISQNKVFEFSGHPFEFSRTRSLFSTTLSIANEFNFPLSKEQVLFARGDIGKANEEYFSWAPPGTAMIGALFYKIFSLIDLGQFGAYLSIVFISVFIHFLIFKIVYQYIKKDEKTALLCAYIYTFGTIALVYSITYFQHQYTVLFLLIMLIGVLKISRRERNAHLYTYLIPIIYGFSAFFDYPNLIILLPILLGYLFISKENIKPLFIKTILSVSIPLLVITFFQYSQFDNPFQPTNTLVSGFNTTLNQTDLQKEKNDVTSIFSTQKTFEGLYSYLFTTYRGIFFFSPIVILGILYIKTLFKIRPRLCLGLLLIVGTTALMYASFSAPLGGWCFGPRYLLPIYLILSVMTGLWISEQSTRIKVLVLPLLFISIANNVSGALSTLTIPEKKETFFYGIKNLEFILNNVSGSFFYRLIHASLDIPLIYYFAFIFLSIMGICLYLIFGKKERKILQK